MGKEGVWDSICLVINYDRLPFAPYFIFKDLITFFIFFIVL
jgi:quinol-cytochrome oxidoreductase complex cytochrome b subunit